MTIVVDSASSSNARGTRVVAAGSVLLILLFTAAYLPTLRTLAGHWAANDMYSYAFGVPLFAVLLVWARGTALQHVRIAPAPAPGTLLTVSGLGLLLLGHASSTNLVAEASLVVTIAGLSLLLFGGAVLRVLALPILYLFAMIPFWELVTVKLHWQFQLYSAAIGVRTLRAFGVPVLRNGQYIELPDITLEVAEACSGVNYLVAVLGIGIPMACLFVKGWSRRALIVLAAATIALFSNGLRVAMVSAYAYHGVRSATGDIHGPFALFRSLLISGVGYVALFALVFKFADERALRPQPLAAWLRFPRAVSLVPLSLAILMLAGVVAFATLHKVTPVPLARALGEFPDRLGAWQSWTAGSFRGDIDQLPFDERLSKNYVGPDGTEVNLSVGYLARQVQGRELVSQELRTLLAGRRQSRDPLLPSGTSPASQLVTSVNGQRYLVTSWYVVSGREIAGDLPAKFFTAWASLVDGRTNGAIVVVKTRIADGQSVAAVRARVGGFLDAVRVTSRAFLAG